MNATAAAETQNVDLPPDDRDEGGGDVVFKRNVEEAEMDMTPMVDIVFQLLIFFMITASFTMQKAMPVPKPKDDRPSTSATQPEEQEDILPLTVIVDHIGSFFLELEDGERQEVPSEQELIVKLRQVRKEHADSTVTVMVKAHGEAPHYRVVMAADSATTAGFGKVGLQTVEDDD